MPVRGGASYALDAGTHKHQRMQIMYQDKALGELRMREAIDKNEDLGEVVTSLLKCSNVGYLFGAVGFLVGCYQASRDAGMVWTAFDESMASFVSATKTQMAIDLSESLNGSDPDLKASQLSELVSAISLFRSQGAVWTPGAVQRPEPLEVRISSLPTRIMETTVSRDTDMEIIKTTQIEQDVFSVAPAP